MKLIVVYIITILNHGYKQVANESLVYVKALTTEKERDWLRVLAAIKRHDPQIYNPGVQFYDDSGTYYVHYNTLFTLTIEI